MPHNVKVIFPIVELDCCLSTACTGVDMKKNANSYNRNGMFHRSFVLTALTDSRTIDRIVGW